MSDFRIIEADCIEAMREMDEASVDAIVTDPPYELGFMSKAWDRTGVAYQMETWEAALRILKPGGHLLAFGGTRTYHRLACAVEDAGFEIRDSLIWLYGSGFPKSLDVSKAIDKAAGAEREVVGPKAYADGTTTRATAAASSDKYGDFAGGGLDSTPATPEAQRWQGWGTALKPSHEPIVVARKPLAGTVAANVQQFGTGALNVDGCRIGMSAEDREVVDKRSGAGRDETDDIYAPGLGRDEGERFTSAAGGRWPANVVLSPEAAEELDRQSGETTSVGGRIGKKAQAAVANVPAGEYEAGDPGYGDTGGASRFFYCAKASRAERNAGLDGFEERDAGNFEDDAYEWATDGRGNPRSAPIRKANVHPTVKPIALMRWLVRLVCPPGGTICDPFLGSGTTGCAAVLEDVDFVGVEREAEYAAIAEARIEHWYRQPVALDLFEAAA